MVQHVAACLAIGSVSKQVFTSEYQIPDEKIFLAPYAVDNGFFISQAALHKLSRAAIKQEMGIPADQLVVLCVAGMVPKKRQQDLIRAMAKIKTPARLVLVGHGPSDGSGAKNLR